MTHKDDNIYFGMFCSSQNLIHEDVPEKFDDLWRRFLGCVFVKVALFSSSL